SGIALTTAQPDISPDSAEDAAEFEGSLPGRRERADRSAGGSPNCTVVAVLREPDSPPIRSLLCFNLRQQFFQQEPDIAVTKTIVFEAAIKPIKRRIGLPSSYSAVHDKHADGH